MDTSGQPGRQAVGPIGSGRAAFGVTAAANTPGRGSGGQTSGAGKAGTGKRFGKAGGPASGASSAGAERREHPGRGQQTPATTTAGASPSAATHKKNPSGRHRTSSKSPLAETSDTPCCNPDMDICSLRTDGQSGDTLLSERCATSRALNTTRCSPLHTHKAPTTNGPCGLLRYKTCSTDATIHGSRCASRSSPLIRNRTGLHPLWNQ